MKVVHQGRGGFVELDDCRYDIEHVDAGHFCIHFRSSICFEKRHEHLAQLVAFAQSRQLWWYVEVPPNHLHLYGRPQHELPAFASRLYTVAE